MGVSARNVVSCFSAEHGACALRLSSVCCIILHILLQQGMLLVLHCSLHSSVCPRTHLVVHQHATHVGASNTITLDTMLHILTFLLYMQIPIALAAEFRA